MKCKTLFLLFLALLASLALRAQQPNTLTFRPVLLPGMSLCGHSFTPETVINSVAINDAGEIALLARWSQSAGQSSIFTSKRVVVRENDIVDSKIVLLPDDAIVAINSTGQVAYEALYADNTTDASGGVARWGIFVEKRLMLDRGNADHPGPFTFTEDGKVVVSTQVLVVTPRPQKKPNIWDHLDIKPPKLPGIPISIKGPQKPPVEQIKPSPATTPSASPLPSSTLPMASNHHGQVLLSINLTDGGFLLLLGTPKE